MKLPNLTQKIDDQIRKFTTYRVGIVQNKTYRLLKQRTAKALASADISSAEWALLGLLYENPKGVRLTFAATELGVEAPFVTALVRGLEKKHLLELQADMEDNRAKRLCLTETGKKIVTTMEPKVRSYMRPAIKGISVRDLLIYFSVSERITKNILALDE